MEITADERLALLSAMDKRLSPELKQAKDEARERLMGLFQSDGIDRKAILVGGQKVGEVGMSYTAERPFIHEEAMDEALAFLEEHGLTAVAPAKGWERDFDLVGGQVVYKPTGEVCTWAGWCPKAAKTAAVRGCKPEDVMRAFGARLSDGAAKLLEGGID